MEIFINQVFKTLVTVSNSKHYYVCVVGVAHELDLKKFRIKTLKSNDIINNELIPYLKSSKIVENDPIDALIN